MRLHKLAIVIGFAASLMAGSSRADIDPQVIASTLRSSVVALTIKGGPRPRPEERSDEAVVPAVRVTPTGIAAASGLLISADGLVLTVASLLDTPGQVPCFPKAPPARWETPRPGPCRTSSRRPN